MQNERGSDDAEKLPRQQSRGALDELGCIYYALVIESPQGFFIYQHKQS